MRPSLLTWSEVLLKVNGTSAQWCVGTCVPTPHAYVTNSYIVVRLSRKSTQFRCCVDLDKTGVEWSHRGLCFTWIDTFFANMCAENDLHISASCDLDLWSYDLKVALPVTTSAPESFNIVGCSVFELTVGKGQTDGRTDRWTGCNA